MVGKHSQQQVNLLNLGKKHLSLIIFILVNRYRGEIYRKQCFFSDNVGYIEKNGKCTCRILTENIYSNNLILNKISNIEKEKIKNLDDEMKNLFLNIICPGFNIHINNISTNNK